MYSVIQALSKHLHISSLNLDGKIQRSGANTVFFYIRYEHGTFWPNLRESDFDYVGDGKGTGYNFNVPLNKTGMTNADYLAIWQQILVPVATEVFKMNIIAFDFHRTSF